MNHFASVLCALCLASCTARETGSPSEASVGHACTRVEALQDNLGMASQGTIAGHSILSEGTVACAEPGLGSVECELTGPAVVRVDAPDGGFTIYRLDEGQFGRLTVGADGAACAVVQ
jgi:hypothetical protein